MKRSVHLLCAIVISLATGCATQGTNTMRSFSDPKSAIDVRVGETFSIELASNVTTGYQWALAEKPTLNVLQHISNRYNAPTDTKDITGVGGTETWIFKAIERGETTIAMKYIRAWDEADSPKFATFRVRVK